MFQQGDIITLYDWNYDSVVQMMDLAMILMGLKLTLK